MIFILLVLYTLATDAKITIKPEEALNYFLSQDMTHKAHEHYVIKDYLNKMVQLLRGQQNEGIDIESGNRIIDLVEKDNHISNERLYEIKAEIEHYDRDIKRMIAQFLDHAPMDQKTLNTVLFYLLGVLERNPFLLHTERTDLYKEMDACLPSSCDGFIFRFQLASQIQQRMETFLEKGDETHQEQVLARFFAIIQEDLNENSMKYRFKQILTNYEHKKANINDIRRYWSLYKKE